MINRFEYEVIDQLVPSSMSDWIEQRLIEYGPWLYNSATSQLGAKFDPNDKNIVDSPQFTNALFTQEEGVCSELYSEVAQPIFWFLEKEIGIKVEQLVRIKANLLMPAEQILTTIIIRILIILVKNV